MILFLLLFFIGTPLLGYYIQWYSDKIEYIDEEERPKLLILYMFVIILGCAFLGKHL